MSERLINNEYAQLLNNLKNQISTSQSRAAVSVNRELIMLYHNIGALILSSQEKHGWGAKIIDKLSTDFKSSFPKMKGFSTRNLKNMRKLAVLKEFQGGINDANFDYKIATNPNQHQNIEPDVEYTPQELARKARTKKHFSQEQNSNTIARLMVEEINCKFQIPKTIINGKETDVWAPGYSSALEVTTIDSIISFASEFKSKAERQAEEFARQKALYKYTSNYGLRRDCDTYSVIKKHQDEYEDGIKGLIEKCYNIRAEPNRKKYIGEKNYDDFKPNSLLYEITRGIDCVKYGDMNVDLQKIRVPLREKMFKEIDAKKKQCEKEWYEKYESAENNIRQSAAQFEEYALLAKKEWEQVNLSGESEHSEL